MPTGYTAGILDGSTRNFKEYAVLCMRAFGATLHMRDEPFSKKYEKRKPSTYHAEALKSTAKRLKDLNKATDEALLKKQRDSILKDIAYHEKNIVEKAKIGESLYRILGDVKSWVPPTDDHIKFREFMIEQIQSTLSWDADNTYDFECLESLKESLKSPKTAEEIRKEELEDIEHDINYHTREQQAEEDRCRDANAWVEALIKSLKK